MNEARGRAVRIMTWNIHGTLGRNPRYDLTRAVELIRRWDPDIVALQEVDSRRGLAGGVNPFEFLPGAVGVYGIHAKSVTTRDGDYGQMLISRWPIAAQDVRDISFPEREPRRAICADLETPLGPIRVVATHLGLSIGERRAQARQLLALAGNGAGTTIMAGDFNDWFWPGSVRSVLAREMPGRTRFRTFPAALPLLRLDRVYCRPRTALHASFTDKTARDLSDHLPVIADVLPQAAS